MKSLLKREDVVIVIAGDDKGKTGKILKVFTGKEKVIVEGVAISKRHMKKTQDYPEGAIIEKAMPIHVSNVMLKSKMDERLSRRNKSA